MRRFCFAASIPIVLILCVAATRAETPTQASGRLRDPARLLPSDTDLLIQAPQPRRLVETLTAWNTLQQLQQLAPGIRDFLDSTNARRLRQLVAYFEKELDAPWPRLLERLAGHGVALGIRFEANPTPLLLVLEGEDERFVQQFFQLGLKILERELTRQEAKIKLVKGSYKGFETVRVGTEYHAAIVGSTLLLSNSEQTLRAGLDRHPDGGATSMAGNPGVRKAAQLLPPQPLVSLWLSTTKIHQAPGADVNYKAPRDNPVLTVGLGHYLDLFGRAPFVCIGVYGEKDGFLATLRTPCGREGMGADQLLHLPPAGAPGSRPLLEPKNVLYSESKYFAIANIWKHRKKLFNEELVRQLEQGEKKTPPFFIGTKLSKLLMQAGPYYRFVAARQPNTSYKTTPGIAIPAFALVWELREPEAFGKALEPILRGAALLGGFQANLKLVEEQYQDCKLIGYRFPEDQLLKGDVDNLRFNFTPCFTRVGDQFVVSSTIDLCRELVDLIRKEGTSPARGDASPARVRLYGSGVAAYLRTIEDLLITQKTLDQAVTPKEARQQVQTFLDVIRGLGVLSLEPRFHDKTFQYDIKLRSAK
jgi:hypothetical protein